jgi:cyclohexa-1,5-dienecarbonyl-CoA hydratase
LTNTLVVRREQRVVSITLDRPPLNILDLETLTQLRQQLELLKQDPGVAVVILRGAGDRAFSAGVAVEDHTPELVPKMLDSFHGAVRALRQLEALSVAVVRGHCLGGGMELAAGCDIVLASDDSRFAQPEIELGCIPPLATALYPNRLGPAKTFDLLVTGRSLDCNEAEQIGFVSRQVPSSQLESELERLVGQITSKSLPVLRLLKRAIIAGRDRSFDEALDESERLYLEELIETEDMHEGLTSFLEKRRPNWKHR